MRGRHRAPRFRCIPARFIPPSAHAPHVRVAGKGKGGGGKGGGGKGKGGRGGGGWAPEGPPDEVMEVGTFIHPCEGEMVLKSTNAKAPAHCAHAGARLPPSRT